MPLPKLESNFASQVLLQRTEFSIDVLGRFACSTWDEAVNNGGAPFDCIVVGSGMYGAYAAAKLARLDPHKQLRILVLEGGPFVVSEHVQNLSRIGYGVFDPIYGQPYTSGVIRPDTGGVSVPEPVANHYYCVGGKSLGWGKWCPRLTAADLAQWPAAAAAYLNLNYGFVEEELGVTPSTDLINGALFNALKARTAAVVAGIPGLQAPLDPPVAVQAQAPASGLFSFDAFSSLPLLIDALREDIADHPGGLKPDSERRLFLVPNARVEQLDYAGGVVTGVRVRYRGEASPRTLPIPPSCDVLLALASMESTRLALRSFPIASLGRPELMGRNLMAHLRSNFTCRIRRNALQAGLPPALQAAALHIPGAIGNRRFHIQLFAAADPHANGEAVLYRLLPDLDSLRDILASQTSEFISFKVLTIGEMIGNKAAPLHAPGTSWMDLSPFETDVFGQPVAYAQWFLSAEEDAFWTAMDQAAVDLVRAIAGSPADIEFDHEPGFFPDPPANLAQYRDSLGSTFHESGTLWMGTDPLTSVTDPNGKFHHVANAFCIDQAIFPTVGSANPVLTGITNARRTVEAIITAHQNAPLNLATVIEPGPPGLLAPASAGATLTTNDATTTDTVFR
ncbi:MAG TPA: GMC oxidoreductase [Opitutaceae bacterium]